MSLRSERPLGEDHPFTYDSQHNSPFPHGDNLTDEQHTSCTPDRGMPRPCRITTWPVKFSQQHGLDACRRATVSLAFVPIFMGSAYKNKGVQLLLDGVSDYLPSPCQVENTALVWHSHIAFIYLQQTLICLSARFLTASFLHLSYSCGVMARIACSSDGRGMQSTASGAFCRMSVPGAGCRKGGGAGHAGEQQGRAPCGARL